MKTVADYRQFNYSCVRDGDPRDVLSVKETPDLFAVLAAEAQLGRTFVADEAVVGRDHTAVLSHGLLEQSLGGQDDVVGTTIDLH